MRTVGTCRAVAMLAAEYSTRTAHNGAGWDTAGVVSSLVAADHGEGL